MLGQVDGLNHSWMAERPEVVFIVNSKSQADDAVAVLRHLERPSLVVALWHDVFQHISRQQLPNNAVAIDLSTRFKNKLRVLAAIVKGRRLVSALTHRAPFPVFVFGDDVNPSTMAVLARVRRRKTRSVLIVDGILDPRDPQRLMNQPSLTLLGRLGPSVLRRLGTLPAPHPFGAGGCDHVAAHGEFMRRTLIDWGVPVNTIAVTGWPQLDRAFREGISAHAPKTYKRALYLGLLMAEKGWATDQTDSEILRALSDFSIANPDVELVIRPHPSEAAASYLRHFAHLGREPLKLDSAPDVAAAVRESSVVAMHFPSSVLLEAMIAGLPTLFFDLGLECQRNSITNHQAVLVGDGEADFLRLMRSVIDNPNSVPRAAQLEFIGLHAGNLDGNSGWRVARLIDSTRPTMEVP